MPFGSSFCSFFRGRSTFKLGQNLLKFRPTFPLWSSRHTMCAGLRKLGCCMLTHLSHRFLQFKNAALQCCKFLLRMQLLPARSVYLKPRVIRVGTFQVQCLKLLWQLFPVDHLSARKDAQQAEESPRSIAILPVTSLLLPPILSHPSLFLIVFFSVAKVLDLLSTLSWPIHTYTVYMYYIQHTCI